MPFTRQCPDCHCQFPVVKPNAICGCPQCEALTNATHAIQLSRGTAPVQPQPQNKYPEHTHDALTTTPYHQDAYPSQPLPSDHQHIAQLQQRLGYLESKSKKQWGRSVTAFLITFAGIAGGFASLVAAISTQGQLLYVVLCGICVLVFIVGVILLMISNFQNPGVDEEIRQLNEEIYQLEYAMNQNDEKRESNTGDTIGDSVGEAVVDFLGELFD